VTREELPPTIGLDVAAKWLGISYESARRRARAGRLPGAFQIGQRWRVSRRGILREIERLAGLNAHEPVIRLQPAAAAADRPPGPMVPAAALKRSQGLSQVKKAAPAFIAASEPSLVHKRARKS
jgi:hypothetical protein